MGVSPDVLPEDSFWFAAAYDVAVDIVDPLFCQVSPTIYKLMVYNLAGSNLLNFAQDPPEADPFKDGKPYFEYYRDKWNLNSPISGVVSSAADQGTATGLEVPDALKNMTLADLQYFQNPYGRQYLAFAQRQGSLWGLS
jgi:hypothetical protein